jgi:signal transduction histidine kinase
MYRRLVLFGLSVVAVAVVALVIPLGLAARDIVHTEELGEIADRARIIADDWQVAWAKVHESSTAQPKIPIVPGDGEVTLILPDGQVLGPPPPEAAEEVVASAKQGRSATADYGDRAYATAPALLDDQDGVVLVAVGAANLREGLLPRLAALAAVSFVLLAFAAVAAWVLARRTVRPIQELQATADAMADGDLRARATPSTIVEVHDVGIALNRLARRVEELLDDERANAAELAHQLRTPLTVLTIDIDSVTDDEVRARLQEDALSLQRTTDEIITTARRSAREGLRARCDAAAIVAERAQFWQVLAEDQHRRVVVDVAPGPLWVRLTADDLTTLTDILLQNVFIHTPEGTAFEITVAAGEQVRLRIRDHGPGVAEGAVHQAHHQAQTGSTGLGLSIAERLADASGGGLEIANVPGGGAEVTVILGPAGE